MGKKFQCLDKKWKEIIYAMSGFGANLLMVLMGAFFTDAVNPSALPVGSLQVSSYAISHISLVLPALFPIIWMLAKILDGVIDVPLASITDNLKSKWGKRRLPIVVCFLPMVISYALCWIPISADNQVLNTLWITLWSSIFFTTYTMCLIAFYGSLSTVCTSERQRTRVSSYKAFFDTIAYCLVYALVPLLLQVTNMHIDKFALILIPLMLTTLIPVFMIKEGEKFEKMAISEGYDIVKLQDEEKVGIFESFKVTLKNKPFMTWCIVNCCAGFGLQLFLVSMNSLILGGMGLSNGHMAILNTCAFAPVPIMLYLFNKLKDKKGLRLTLQTCLLGFSVCIFSFLLGSNFVLGEGNIPLKIVIGCIGGIFGSWGISSFFMVPYLVPSQIAAIEEKVTGKNISAMFFATNAVLGTVVGAISGSLIYENIKMLFISKSAHGIVWAENAVLAAEKLGVDASSVFNLGLLLVPFIVSLFCAIGFVLAFRMPKDYTFNEVIKHLDIDHSKIELEPEEVASGKESILLNVALYILSAGVFGLIWRYNLYSYSKAYKSKKGLWINYIISILIPPYNGYLMFKASKAINKNIKDSKHKDSSIVSLIFGLLCLDFIPCILIQKSANKLIEESYE